MLRESSLKTGHQVDLSAIKTGTVDAQDLAGVGVQNGVALLRFVDAMLIDPADIDAARENLMAELQPEAFVDTCATLASFNAVVKVADGTGIPLEDAKRDKTVDLREALDIDNLRDHGRFGCQAVED